MIETAREVFKQEIESLEKIKSNLNDSFTRAVDILYKATGRVIVSGIGKSGNIGKKIAATLSSTGTPSIFLHPVEALHGDLGVIKKTDAFLILSKSGETEELIRLVENVKRFNCKIIGILGNSNSTLSKAVDEVLDVAVEREACPLNLAPTSSTTAMLVMGDALAVALLKKKKFTRKDFAFFHPGGSLGRKLLLVVEDLMHKGDELPRITPESKMEQVIFEISRKRLGVTIIVDAENKLLGIITDGDLRRLMEKYQEKIFQLKAKDIMIQSPKTITKNILASQALDIMEKNKITSLPVVDKDGKLQGLIHIHDILEAKVV